MNFTDGVEERTSHDDRGIKATGRQVGNRLVKSAERINGNDISGIVNRATGRGDEWDFILMLGERHCNNS